MSTARPSIEVNDSNTARELIKKGLTYLEKSDHISARQLFNSVLEKLAHAPLNFDEKALISSICYYQLANIEVALGNDQGAFQSFLLARNTCLKVSFGSPEYIKLRYEIEINLGLTCLDIGKFDTAASSFAKARQQVEKANKWDIIPAVTSYLGLALVLSGKHQEGFTQLEKASSLYPIETRNTSQDWSVHCYNLGNAYQKTGNYNKAVAAYTQSLCIQSEKLGTQNSSEQMDPNYLHSVLGDTYAELGQCYFYLKNLTRAEYCLTRALKEYVALNMLPKINDTKKMLKALEKAHVVTPANQESHADASRIKKYLQYGLGASFLVCAGLFAYKLCDGSKIDKETLNQNSSMQPRR